MSALRLTFRRDVFTLSADTQRHDWRWTLTASNGRIVGCSSEAYVKRLDAVKNAALVLGVTVSEMRVAVDQAVTNDMVAAGVIRPNDERIVVEVEAA